MLEMHEIRYFTVLARELHFSRAAEKCCVSQPALTRAIRKLESKLGGLLFDRRPGNISLTALGQTVLPRLETALVEIEQARSDAAFHQEERLQMLRIGVMCTAGPGYIIPQLSCVASKDGNIELSIREARAGTIVDMLLADEVDVGIAAWPSYPDTIEVIPCYMERYAVALPDGHVLAKLESVPLYQLAGENYLERLNCEFDPHFAHQVGEWPLDMTTRFSSEREDWIQCMVANNQGIAIVPEYMEVLGGITVRPLSEPSIARQISLLTVRGRIRSRAVDRFVRSMKALKWTEMVARKSAA